MPTRDKQLDDALASIRRIRDDDIAALQRECERIVELAGQRVIEAIRFHGKKPCSECAGTGVIQKWNPGYWHTFGLRSWKGCKNCGGDGGETKGCGYVDA